MIQVKSTDDKQLVFDYTNRGPSVAPHLRTNRIMVWKKDGQFFYTRQYIRNDGTPGVTITGRFTNNPIDLAHTIHWGCCGWQANYLQIHDLIAWLKQAVQSLV